jgi:hypothetical protein
VLLPLKENILFSGLMLYLKRYTIMIVARIMLIVVTSIRLQGVTRILAIEPFNEVSEENYISLFSSLQDSGLKKAWWCISDVHHELQNAKRKKKSQCLWQRYRTTS